MPVSSASLGAVATRRISPLLSPDLRTTNSALLPKSSYGPFEIEEPEISVVNHKFPFLSNTKLSGQANPVSDPPVKKVS